ncbi:helix-turn-helix protein [Rathayibacter iranicus]|nr:helix-turn-helix protein [Rathayibacter iranicus] [Rathayibacter iranicus NCPPB 2253 = VKM Ac-1602]
MENGLPGEDIRYDMVSYADQLGHGADYAGTEARLRQGAQRARDPAAVGEWARYCRAYRLYPVQKDRMFATDLRGARLAAGLSVARLAELAGTWGAVIGEYESGRKRPRVDTAERLFEVLGLTLAPVLLDRAPSFWFASGVLEPLEQWVPDRARALADADRNFALAVDADANAEGLSVRWAQVSTLADGTTVDGDS